MNTTTQQNPQSTNPDSNELLMGFLIYLQQNGMTVGTWSKIGDYLNPVSKADREKMIKEYLEFISKPKD